MTLQGPLRKRLKATSDMAVVGLGSSESDESFGCEAYFFHERARLRGYPGSRRTEYAKAGLMAPRDLRVEEPSPPRRGVPGRVHGYRRILRPLHRKMTVHMLSAGGICRPYLLLKV